MWEHFQDTAGGPIDLAGDVALIKQVLADAASLGMDVIIDLHNQIAGRKSPAFRFVVPTISMMKSAVRSSFVSPAT
jgi:hypothetical protein